MWKSLKPGRQPNAADDAANIVIAPAVFVLHILKIGRGVDDTAGQLQENLAGFVQKHFLRPF